ncbi:hypothetical protein N4G58_14320 [Edwardsiella piscicida]|nr:hypothetical protein N4G58_14320 [Edwardsiella piscicida]
MLETQGIPNKDKTLVAPAGVDPQRFSPSTMHSSYGPVWASLPIAWLSRISG